jgi:hypothetical protein
MVLVTPLSETALTEYDTSLSSKSHRDQNSESKNRTGKKLVKPIPRHSRLKNLDAGEMKEVTSEGAANLDWRLCSL